MNNKLTTTETIIYPKPTPQTPPALAKKIGKTTYRVWAHSSNISTSNISTATIEDKIKRLLREEVRQAPFNLPQIQAIINHNDMDLYTLGSKNGQIGKRLADYLGADQGESILSPAGKIHHLMHRVFTERDAYIVKSASVNCDK